MIIDEDIAPIALHHLGQSGAKPSLVVIGAMDGISFDGLAEYITTYRWPGLFVEPMPEQFRRLWRRYAQLGFAESNRYENSAIADHDGTVRMLTISQDAVDTGEVHPCFGGMSSIYPPRNGLASPGDAAVVDAYGELVEVECITLATLFRRHAVDRVDVLAIDTEGWDYRILRQLDFALHRPKFIRCEWVNLTLDEQAQLTALLESHRYVASIVGQNVDAVPAEYWAELEALPRAPAPPPAAPVRARRVTLVTGFFPPPGTRDAADTEQWLITTGRLLEVPWPMVVFTTPELAARVARLRWPAPTLVQQKTERDLESFPFWNELLALHTPEAAPAGRTDDARARGRLEVLALSKQFFLNDASVMNPFSTRAFLWIEPDVAGHHGDPASLLDEACETRLAELMRGEEMLWSAPSGRALFGGERAAIGRVNARYYIEMERQLRSSAARAARVIPAIVDAHRRLCRIEPLLPGAA